MFKGFAVGVEKLAQNKLYRVTVNFRVRGVEVDSFSVDDTIAHAIEKAAQYAKRHGFKYVDTRLALEGCYVLSSAAYGG